MELDEQKGIFDKIKNIEELKNTNKELLKVDNILELYKINEKLLKIINKELEKEIVPSKGLLDTIQEFLIISVVLS